eukprot:1339626-Rhodomonas_salina.4
MACSLDVLIASVFKPPPSTPVHSAFRLCDVRYGGTMVPVYARAPRSPVLRLRMMVPGRTMWTLSAEPLWGTAPSYR